MSVNEERFETLTNELRGILIDGTEVGVDESGYNASAEAMWRAALAAFNFVASEVGATGFQASWAALKFYAEAMRYDCPISVFKADDALYPQYDLPARLATWLEECRPWLREQAVAKLNGQDMEFVAPAVEAHWHKLAAR